jgi:hypothetical protein
MDVAAASLNEEVEIPDSYNEVFGFLTCTEKL